MTEQTAIEKFLNNPQKLLEHIEKTGDFEVGFDYVRVVYEVVSKFDATLDVVLRGMEDLWKPEEHGGKQFFQAAIEMTPLAPTTIKRHTKVGKMLNEVPEKFRPRIESMDFQSKIYIASLSEDVVNGEIQVTDEQWGRIVEQPSRQGVAMEIHNVRGTEPRSQFCHFQFDENGDIWAYTSKGLLERWKRIPCDNEEMEEYARNFVDRKAFNKLEATLK